MNILRRTWINSKSGKLIAGSILGLMSHTAAQAGELSWSAWIDSGYILWNGTELSQTVGARGSINYDFDNGLYIGAWWRKDTAKDGCDEIDYVAWYKAQYNDLKVRFQAGIYDICNPKVKWTEADILTGQLHLNTWPWALSGFYGHPTAKGKKDGWGLQPKYNFNEYASAWFRIGQKEWTWNEYLVLQWSLWHDVWDNARIWIDTFLETVEEGNKWFWAVIKASTKF